MKAAATCSPLPPGALLVWLGISLPAGGWMVALLVMLAGAGALAVERARGESPA